MNGQKAGSPFQVGFGGLTAGAVYHPEYKRVSQMIWVRVHLPAWEKREIQAELCKGAGKQGCVKTGSVNANSNLPAAEWCFAKRGSRVKSTEK